MGRLVSAYSVLPWLRRSDTPTARADTGPRPSSINQREAVEIEAAVRLPTQRWLALAGLVWRTAGVVVAVQGAWIWLQAEPLLLAVAIVVVLANVVTIAVLARRPDLIGLLDSRTFLAVDVGLAFGLNLLASWVIQAGTLYGLGQYRDLFSPYLWGTVVVWTGIRGPLMGALFVVLAAAPLQVGMAWLNNFSLETTPLAFVDRNMWLLTSYVLAVSALAFARRAASATARQALRAGKEAERAEVLRRMHDTVLQTLEGIVLQASQTQTPALDRLQAVSTTASRQAIALRAVLQEDHKAPSASLATRLRTLTEEFIASNIRVEVILSEIVDLEPEEPIREALAGAIREALNNVAKHSGAQHAVVRATPSKGGIQVTIRDHGCGFVGNASTHGVGLRGSVIERMQRVSGTAEVWSQPGAGTRVTLWAPLSSASE